MVSLAHVLSREPYLDLPDGSLTVSMEMEVSPLPLREEVHPGRPVWLQTGRAGYETPATWQRANGIQQKPEQLLSLPGWFLYLQSISKLENLC